MNKLDYLAQKEEELRKLNDQLDNKQQNLLKDIESSTSKPPQKDLFANDMWKVHQPPPEPEENKQEA